LTLLSAPLNVGTLTALAEGPMPLMELRRTLGMPPQTTTRKYLKELAELGVVERRRTPGFGGTVHFGLTRAGRDLILAAAALDAWLGGASDGKVELGQPAAKRIIEALVGGWSTMIIRAIAAQPLALTELSNLIPTLNYPSLERRLVACRLAGLVEPIPSGGRGTPYRVTLWLHRAMGPILECAYWERQHLRDAANPFTARDIEAVFLLLAPLADLPEGCSGSSRLVIETNGKHGSSLAGAVMQVDRGKIVSCVCRLATPADSSAVGGMSCWYETFLKHEFSALEIGGDANLAIELLTGLSRAIRRQMGRRTGRAPNRRPHDSAPAEKRLMQDAGKSRTFLASPQR
jgi:DNA-binding HxlR family transcriptional regulator